MGSGNGVEEIGSREEGVRNVFFFFFLMVRRPPGSTQGGSSAASDVYRGQGPCRHTYIIHT